MSELSEQEQQYFQTGGNVELPEEATSSTQAAADPPPTPPTPPTHTAAPEVATSATSDPAKPAEPAKPFVDPPEVQVEKNTNALKEAREQNRQLRAQLAQLSQAQQQAARQFQEMQQRLNPGQQPPSFEENPAQHLQVSQQTLDRRLQQIEQQNQHAAQMQQLMNQGLTEDQAVARIQYEEMQLAGTAAQMGQNPSALIYQLAHSRGYQKPTGNLTSGQNTSTVAQPSKLETVKAGLDASKPMANVGGGGQVENLTWDWVAHSSDDEFLANWNKMEKEANRSARH
jgi:predicted RNase H-like nuclease (RuvC/YqgF family)